MLLYELTEPAPALGIWAMGSVVFHETGRAVVAVVGRGVGLGAVVGVTIGLGAVVGVTIGLGAVLGVCAVTGLGAGVPGTCGLTRAGVGTKAPADGVIGVDRVDGRGEVVSFVAGDTAVVLATAPKLMLVVVLRTVVGMTGTGMVVEQAATPLALPVR